ncbi:MAG TPA: two-component regulator propeller domain-containing protein [Bryobacteraceae bacterium]|nr:two-component regulator propeller domain-containing protein [Bryobacteraceae bacterium]HZW94751.1 two-component regulator propeller domain-containing protein [Candidatus Eremiobacteraceae bacterium]
MDSARKRHAASVLCLLAAMCPYASALNPDLDISQYAHAAWTVREGFFKGAIYTIAQTPDGYLWLGTEFGLFRFDGVRSVPWEPPAGQHLPGTDMYALLAARDGALWIGTFAGLVTWSGARLTPRRDFDGQFVTSLLQDNEGTVWAGILASPAGRLCAMRSGIAQCYGEDGIFGRGVFSLYEDNSGTLWVGAQSGLWRWKPGPPKRYVTPPTEINDLKTADDGRLLISMHEVGLRQLAGENLKEYPIPGAVHPNKLLRDRDGALWIGTVDRGIIHVHHGRTDTFSRSDGLSGDVIFRLFEDREGNVWAATSGGLDRFRELPFTTISEKEGLSSNATQSVVAATDGSVWIGAQRGLTRWKNGQTTVFRKATGLPDDMLQSLYQDDGGRIWASTPHGLAYFQNGRFVPVTGVGSGEVHFMAGDKAGNLWLSEDHSLWHLREGRLVEQIPWSELGHHGNASVIAADREQVGLWLGFWGGGVSYFKDRQLRASYTASNGLAEGNVAGLQLDGEGALWAATEGGGVSRLKDGHIATLTSRNGLPCDKIHWTIEDDDSSFWLYTACGLVRIMRTELDAWIADPKHRVEVTVWDASDGVRLRSGAATGHGPRVVKSTGGKLWYVTGDGVQVVDPRHLVLNKLPPPVHIERIAADDRPYDLRPGMRLPANVRNLRIDYTALCLVAPEKIHFKYKLEGQNRNWHEVINERQVSYTNLPPRNYRFRVIASNNNGVWNETGDTLEFSIAPAYYQTTWFGALCVAAFLAGIWGLYRLRLYQIAREFAAQTEERTRIARELHDTLLQGFQASLIQMQAARNMFDRRPEKAVQSLDDAITMAAGSVAEGRSAIQDLRAQPAGGADLVQLLTAAGQELAHSDEAPENPPAFRLTVEGERRDLEPLLQDEVYRIARELLRNSFRHAQASRIEAEIRYESRQLRVHIRDDGKGIDPEILKAGGRAGHWGMSGMRERADRFGGKLEFWSEAGAGTEAVLTLPAAAAYGASNGGSFSFLRRKNTDS